MKVVVRLGTADKVDVVFIVVVDGDAMMLIWILQIRRDAPNQEVWKFWDRVLVRE